MNFCLTLVIALLASLLHLLAFILIIVCLKVTTCKLKILGRNGIILQTLFKKKNPETMAQDILEL